MFNYAMDNRQLAHHSYTATALILHHAAQPGTPGTIFYSPIHHRRSVASFGKTSNYQTNLDPCNPLCPEGLYPMSAARTPAAIAKSTIRHRVASFEKTSNYQTNLDPCNPLFPGVL